jgi:hypothetical protein
MILPRQRTQPGTDQLIDHGGLGKVPTIRARAVLVLLLVEPASFDLKLYGMA